MPRLLSIHDTTKSTEYDSLCFYSKTVSSSFLVKGWCKKVKDLFQKENWAVKSEAVCKLGSTS
jgi:hypothetical protein